jgi:hypothetical protein
MDYENPIPKKATEPTARASLGLSNQFLRNIAHEFSDIEFGLLGTFILELEGVA